MFIKTKVIRMDGERVEKKVYQVTGNKQMEEEKERNLCNC